MTFLMDSEPELNDRYGIDSIQWQIPRLRPCSCSSKNRGFARDDIGEIAAHSTLLRASFSREQVDFSPPIGSRAGFAGMTGDFRRSMGRMRGEMQAEIKIINFFIFIVQVTIGPV